MQRTVGRRVILFVERPRTVHSYRRNDWRDDPWNSSNDSCSSAYLELLPISFATRFQPSCRLGTLGTQWVAWRNFAFEIRCERPSVSETEPIAPLTHRGSILGFFTPSSVARRSKASRLRMGASSVILYVPAGTLSAAHTADAASSSQMLDMKESAAPSAGVNPRLTEFTMS